MKSFVAVITMSTSLLLFSCAEKKDDSKSKTDPEVVENQPEDAAEVGVKRQNLACLDCVRTGKMSDIEEVAPGVVFDLLACSFYVPG